MTRVTESDLRRMKGVPSEALALILDAVDAAANPGPWVVTIPGFVPPSVNALMTGHWAKRAAVKKRAMNAVNEAVRAAGVPLATGRRRIAMTVSNDRGRPLDADNAWKAVKDALVHSGRLIDDSVKWVDETTPAIARGPKCTVITIEDVNERGE